MYNEWRRILVRCFNEYSDEIFHFSQKWSNIDKNGILMDNNDVEGERQGKKEC